MDQAPYSKLKKLITARNRLIHAKSESAEFPESNDLNAWKKFSEKQSKQSQSFEDNVHNAFSSLVTMSLYLDRVQEHYNPLPSYDDLNVSMREYSTDLKKRIDNNREIVEKLFP